MVLLLAMARKTAGDGKYCITRSTNTYRRFPCMYLTFVEELKHDPVYALSRGLAEVRAVSQPK